MKLSEGWKEVEIGNIAECSDGDWILSENMSDKGELGIIQLKHIGEGKFLNKNFNFITNEVCKKLKCTVLEEGDLLVSRMAEPICRSCILPKLEFKTVTAVDITIVRPDVKLVDKRFLNLIFNSYVIKNQTTKYTTGTTRERISRKNLEKLKVPLPSLKTQMEIVSTLEKAEKLKQLRDEADKLTKDFLKAVFLKMFGKINCDEITLKELIDSDSTISYGIVQPGNDVPEGLPILRPVDITSNEIDFSKIKKIDPNIEKGYEKTRLQGGEILIVVRGEPGAVVITDSKVKNYNITRGLAVIRVDSRKTNPLYLLEFLKSEKSQNYIKLFTKGATLRQINLVDLRNLSIPIPPLSLQNGFAEIAKKFEIIKEYQRQSKEQIENMFNNLMQKAFRGELAC